MTKKHINSSDNLFNNRNGFKMLLSIIVPMYNEENRLSPFLMDLINFLEADVVSKELILVNDGSTDQTLTKIKNLSQNKSWIKILSYNQNQGKGYAVKKGVLESKGEQIIFIDVDGSIHPNQIPIMLNHLKKYDVVVGNRQHEESKIQQSEIRKFLGMMFNGYVGWVFNSKVKDNLCGFKGFRREIALVLFKNLISERWIFDVELFHYIKKRNYSLYQMPIEWEHKTDSKISLIDPFLMGCKILKLRLKLLKDGLKRN